MKTTALLSLCLVATLLGGDPTEAITKETVMTFYRPFKRLTKEPHRVAPLTATLCTSPSPELLEREKRATGPHYHASVHIYANPLADEAIKRKNAGLPEGAVIVKEKLAEVGSTVGVGGMVKRAAGFDAKNGDWEYFYSDKTAGFSMGRMANCAGCHSSAKGTDYLFSVWKSFDSRLGP